MEEQQAESVAGRRSAGPPPTPEQSAQETKTKTLQLSRAHVIQQLQRATNPRHRKLLEGALRDLDAKLADLA